MSPWRSARRSSPQALLLALLAGLTWSFPAQSELPAWQNLWTAYAARFIETQGRVVDFQRDGATTSEGQAYVLFFQLVANDRAGFARSLRWTQDNLAGGNLDRTPPAWLWGQRDDGSYGVLDAEPATDADLWLAYVLLEAGRLWQQADYTRIGRALLEQVAGSRIVQAGDWGLVLLPGSHPHWRGSSRLTLNPSYLVPFQLRRFMREAPDAPWGLLLRDLPDLFAAIAPRGLAPDWVDYRLEPPGWSFETGAAIGSYDAIRCYLWAGISAKDDNVARRVRDELQGMTHWLKSSGQLPERVDVLTGQGRGIGPAGFSAALLPLLAGRRPGTDQQRRLERLYTEDRALFTRHYYDATLILFGLGWQQGAYRMDHRGQLQLEWNEDANGY